MRIKQLIFILLVMLIAIVIFPQQSNAEEAGVNPSKIIDGAESFLNKASSNTIIDGDGEKDAVDSMYYIMLAVGIVLAFIVGSVLGIQFITTGAVGQAKVKEKLIVFVVGAIVIFGAFGIWRLVYNAFNNIF